MARTITLTDKQYEIVVALVEEAAIEAADYRKNEVRDEMDALLTVLDEVPAT